MGGRGGRWTRRVGRSARWTMNQLTSKTTPKNCGTGSNVFVAVLNKIARPSDWSNICFITSHDGAHAETPRSPASEEESGTISCPKRLAPRAMWPVPTRAQKDSHLAHISLKKDSCTKRARTPRETRLTTSTTPHCQANKSACW